MANSSVMTQNKSFAPKDFKTDVHADWCPGCGDFGILNVLQKTYSELGLLPHKTVTYSGVGCSSKMPHYIKTYGVHTLHGRSLPFATGTKLANPDLTVVVVGGDGDGYGIGVGHFIHTGRRNIDLTYIVHNNEVYGLTKGQASPTLSLGEQLKSLPLPNINEGVNPLAMAVSAGYTFVARSYAFNAAHLLKTLKRAILHRGMAIVDVLQPCPTYNNLHTTEWFSQSIELNGQSLPRLYDIETEGYDGVVRNFQDLGEIEAKKCQAIERLMHREPRIPLGVFYQTEQSTLMDRLIQNIPVLKETPGVLLPIEDPETHRPVTDLSEAYRELLTSSF